MIVKTKKQDNNLVFLNAISFYFILFFLLEFFVQLNRSRERTERPDETDWTTLYSFWPVCERRWMRAYVQRIDEQAFVMGKTAKLKTSKTEYRVEQF